MKRNARLIVMAVAVVTAAAPSFGVYRAIQPMPVRKVEIGTVPVVVATTALPVGTRLTDRPPEGGGLAGAHAGAWRVRRSEASSSIAASSPDLRRTSR